MTEAVLCKLADLAETGSRGFRVGEGDWPLKGFVVQLADGALKAWVNSCPHAGHALDLVQHRFLTPDRRLIQCASHGALFEPASGLCVGGPCPGKRLRSIAIVLRDDEVRLASIALDVDNARLAQVPSGGGLQP